MVLEVPYAIISNVRNNRVWTLSVAGRDTRAFAYNQLQARSSPVSYKVGKPGVLVYVGDVITFTLRAACNDAAAAAFDLLSVNFSTGVTSAATVGFRAKWQTQIKVTITAIDASSGAITSTTAWS